MCLIHSIIIKMKIKAEIIVIILVKSKKISEISQEILFILRT